MKPDRRPRKRFGQHFLHDRNIIEKMVTAIAPEADQHFIEIGPGHGALTIPLLQRCAKIDVVEIDRDLVAKLRT
jgi:16S rRNA (adenine1518-N6/adenine1519-N6)-dimethyltransferase